ncbi:MAG: TolC family protein [Sandaracinaceae bacterium]|nr:TolC family protein [Sandaracinaceae bacterium]
MSKYSLANAGIVATALLILGSSGAATAQTRTPTSPLDTPEQAPTAAPPVVTVVPAQTDDSTATRPADIALPDPRAVASEPLDLSTLLPAGLSSSLGMTPEAALLRAREVSLDARRARARTESADAALQGARRGYAPRASITARYTRLSSYTPGTIQSFDTPGCLEDVVACQADPESFLSEVVLQQPILDQYALTASVALPLSDYIGSARHELAAARLERDASLEAERGAEQDTVLTTLETYFELVRARAQLEVAHDAVEVAQQRAADTRVRAESGVATAGAVLDAQASLEALVRLEAVSGSRVSVADRALRDLLELEDDVDLLLSVELAALPTEESRDANELRLEARANDPYARAALMRAEAQSSRADAERARMFPSLSVGLNYTYANPNTRIFPQTTEFQGTWDLSAQLTFSLDGTLLADARRQQRLALALESSLGAESDSRRAGRAAVQAQGALIASLAEVEARRAAATSASRQDRDVSEQFAVGLATSTDVLAAQAGALRARLDLVDAVVDAHLASARLLRALGGTPAP